MSTQSILIADDDPDVLKYLETALLCHDYSVIAAQDGAEALDLLREHNGRVSLLILDIMMPVKDGIETLHGVRKINPDLPVVILSGASDPERIVQAMKAGASEYLTKPVVHEQLLATIEKNAHRESFGGVPLPHEPGEGAGYLHLNREMKAITQSLKKVADWVVPVVFRGESGVGKEVLAQELHRLSPRAAKPFVKINCVALPSELLESELFGYERGAFTGAFKTKPGKFEMADGGTIFLDEIGDMDLKLQAKLLQVLQDGEFHRLGGKDPVRVDTRVLVATHCDLEQAIENGQFREDLYYRLNVISLRVPPLRERKDEILPFAKYFLKKHCRADMQLPDIPLELKRALVDYDWPGNVRELENAMRNFLVFQDPVSLAATLKRKAVRREARFGVPNGKNVPAAAVAGAVETPGTKENLAKGNVGQAGGPPVAAPDDRTADDALAAIDQFEPPLSLSSQSQPAAIPKPLDYTSTDVSASADLQSHQRGDLPTPAVADSFPEYSTALPHPSEKGSDGGVDGSDTPWQVRLSALELTLRRLVSSIEDNKTILSATGKPPSEPGPPSDSPDPSPDKGKPSFEDGQISTMQEVDRARDQAETEAILAALTRTKWNRKKAASLLRTDYKALLYRMKKLGIDRSKGGTSVH